MWCILVIPPSPAFQLAQVDIITHSCIEELSTMELIIEGKQIPQKGQLLTSKIALY